MCTAITYQTVDFYFGRTLDYPVSYGEEVVVTPRHFPFHFRHTGTVSEHYALIGMAHVVGEYPLYYEAVNERGLGMAGLNFPGNAVYRQPVADKENVAVFEFVPWIVAQCATVAEARDRLSRLQLVDTPFSEALPPATFHWMIADKTEAITVESTAEGLMIYDNPVGVMTNNPPFPQHLMSLRDYRHLSARDGESTFAPGVALPPYCGGMGAIGLPGDYSSRSRFIRAAFVKLNARSTADDEAASVGQFFHIMDSVAMPRGAVLLADDQPDLTLYTACVNATRGIYYYTTYGNRQITAVDMHGAPLDGENIVRYALCTEEKIYRQNEKIAKTADKCRFV